MAFNFTITGVSNSISVTPSSNNISIAQTGTQVSINTNATVVINKNQADTFKGEWVSGRAYLRGDSVTYLGELYLAVYNVTSTLNPSIDFRSPNAVDGPAGGHWVVYSVSQTTSTFNTLTVLTSLVAKPNSVITLDHPALPSAASISVVSAEGPPHSNLLVSASQTNFSGNVGVSGDLYVQGGITAGPPGPYDNGNSLYIDQGNVQLSQGSIYLQSGKINVDDKLFLSSFSSSGLITGTSVTVNVSSDIVLATDYNAGSIYIDGTLNVHRGNFSIQSDGYYAGGVKVINTSGHWVGPAIDMNDIDINFDQTLNTTDSVSFAKVTTGPVEASGIKTLDFSSQTQLDSWDAGIYSTAKYLVRITDEAKNFHIVEYIVATDGTDVYVTEYGVTLKDGALGTFQFDIVSSNVRMLFTPASDAGGTLKASISKTLMAV